MANDERPDTFIREVDEELRREQLKALWDRFGWMFIGICVLIVVITAGYRGWIWWEERKAAQAGDRYVAALEAIDEGNREEGEATLNAIASEGEAGYAALAKLKLAGESAAAGDGEAALAAYEKLAADATLSRPLRDLSRMRAALLALDMGDTEGAVERAGALDAPGNPWRHAAREVLGTAAYKSGDLEKAFEYFTTIQQDAETPPDIWQRSGLMIALIGGQLAAPGDEAAAVPAADAPVAGEEAPAAAPATEEAAPAAAVEAAPAAEEAAPPPEDNAPAAEETAPAEGPAAPAVEEPAAEESAVQEPAAQEPVAQEPVAEQPAAEEPAVEENAPGAEVVLPVPNGAAPPTNGQ